MGYHRRAGSVYPAINQCVHKTACRHPLRVEVMTELRPHEDAAVKADQGDPFRVLAGPAERFQLANRGGGLWENGGRAKSYGS